MRKLPLSKVDKKGIKWIWATGIVLILVALHSFAHYSPANLDLWDFPSWERSLAYAASLVTLIVGIVFAVLALIRTIQIVREGQTKITSPEN